MPGRLPIVLGGGALLGLVGGALAEKHASYALLLALCIVVLASLAMLGDRAFAWAIVLVSVAPWYPLVSHEAVAPVVKQKVLCAAVAAAVLAPWLWSVAREKNRTRLSRSAFLLGILYACFTVLIYDTLGSVSAMISSTIVGFLFAGVAFLCARRFTDAEDWPAAAFTGLAILVLLGADAYASARGNRVGYFSGHPITYGALIVGLTPAALLWAWRHSRLLTAAVATASAVFLLLSESRSSWIASAVILLIVLLLLARRADLRALTLIATVTVVVASVILSTGTLGSIVERKLSPNLTSSQSYTHRLWSVNYATTQIERHPLLGANAPGFSAKEASNRTSIGAIDNGYLSISVDMGLIGLLAAAVPILVAAYVIARCLLLGLSPPVELSLALGVIGIAVVSAFYDSFYWAQLDLLLGAMGGVLSRRVTDL
jgi:O-antigen ligase